MIPEASSTAFPRRLGLGVEYQRLGDLHGSQTLEGEKAKFFRKVDRKSIEKLSTIQLSKKSKK